VSAIRIFFMISVEFRFDQGFANLSDNAAGGTSVTGHDVMPTFLSDLTWSDNSARSSHCAQTSSMLSVLPAQ